MEKRRLNRISIVLDELGLDQLDLAKILEVNKDTVSRWCRNANQPKLSEFYNIARIFRIDITRLIEKTSWEEEVGLSILDKYKEKKAQEILKNKKTTTKVKRNK